MPEIIPGLYLIMKERTYIYKSMSELFRGKLSRPLLEAVTRERFLDLGVTIGEEFDRIKQGHRLICDFTRQFEKLPQIEDVLHSEYEEILAGAEFVLQRNYETSAGDILGSLKQFFDKENWVQPNDFPREPDHVSVECEFMVHLCAESRKSILDRMPNVVSENLNVQRDFLSRHVYNWFPRFSEELSRRARSGFYRGVAELASGFIAVDKDVFHAIMEVPS